MHPIVAIHEADGVIKRTDMDSGIYPADGETLDHFHYVHRIYDLEGLTSGEFINTRVWDEDSDSFIPVPRKPNAYAGWDKNNSRWTWDTELVLVEVRTERNRRLMYSDWMVMSDSPLSQENKDIAVQYRDTLRNLPSTLDMDVVMSVDDVTWPDSPF